VNKNLSKFVKKGFEVPKNLNINIEFKDDIFYHCYKCRTNSKKIVMDLENQSIACSNCFSHNGNIILFKKTKQKPFKDVLVGIISGRKIHFVERATIIGSKKTLKPQESIKS